MIEFMFGEIDRLLVNVSVTIYPESYGIYYHNKKIQIAIDITRE